MVQLPYLQPFMDATLGVYELNRVDLLRDVFLFAYERSCQQYTAAKQSLRPPEPFRNRYRRRPDDESRRLLQRRQFHL